MDTILYFSSSSTLGGAHKTYLGAQAEATRRGIHLQFVDREPTPPLVHDLARVWHPVGAIVNCGGPWNDLDTRMFASLPAVSVGHNPETLPPGALSVLHDSAGTARAAARELLATGFRHFAFVSQPSRRHWSETRGRVFAETIRLHGADCHVLKSAGRQPESAVWQRMIRAFLRALPRPCGLFAATDLTASDILAAARELGVVVPGELAVLGVDNLEELCESTLPTLSSIEPDFRRAGALAVRALVGQEGPSGGAARGGEWVYGDLGIVRRASTRPLASHDAVAAKALALIRREALSGLRPARVAALFPCSRRRADKRFRKAVGRSIGKEIHAVQLEEVKRLASDPDRQLKAIADLCGFGSPGSLRNFFRRETGMSLTAWRRTRP